MTQTAAPKMTAVEKRYAFIREATAPLNDIAKARTALQQAGLDAGLVPDLDVTALTMIALDMRSKGFKLGKTDRWQASCCFAHIEITRQQFSTGSVDQSFARWAVLQGSVFMGHAAE